MSELKTLKDIDPEACCHGIRSDDLKREAIFWYHKSDSNKHAFIMEFFNLTKEDLLEAKNKK